MATAVFRASCTCTISGAPEWSRTGCHACHRCRRCHRDGTRRMTLSEAIPFLGALIALLLGLAIGKAWERYKLRDGKWIDRRRARDSHHYVLGLNFLVANQIDLAIEELSQAARVDSDALEIHLILGNVHRERGQVARAIQVHQALLQRPKPTQVERAYVPFCI